MVMEACIVENDADRHVPNLAGIPIIARIGADDRTVHPYFVRRMYRLLKEEGGAVNYTEVAGKEHWWWDTRWVLKKTRSQVWILNIDYAWQKF